ncbi:MAG: TnpV protein, partial [Clostridia bacterium]|nr:TnpV protein [Clostridia bacterium]
EQTNYAIGKYGKMRLNFMKAHRKGTYTTILTQGRLNSYLHGIDEAAEVQLSKIISETAQRLGVTEQMKAENQLEWVRMMNNIKHSAEETVLKELIYV